MSAVVVLLAMWIAVGTVLPYLPLAHGFVRVGDFPRQQMLVAALVLLLASFWLTDWGAWWITLQAVLALTAFAQVWHIAEFTPLVSRQTADFDPGTDVGGEGFRLVSANVKMSNHHYADMASMLEREAPDIVVLMEVDDRWRDGLAGFLKRYDQVIDECRDNSYGMIVATRLSVEDVSAQCLLTDGVPSVIATLSTPDGQRFRLYCIHPEPPVPHQTTEGRDGETSLVALKVREETLPVIVTGDLNDVAWSRTTRRFRRISRLLDPRIGRRIFSTFDARIPFMRWPLDHLFHSADFRLADMRRLPPCGSDHFPVAFDLVICPREDAEERPEEADEKDMERARDLVRAADERTDEPIGTDWEK